MHTYTISKKVGIFVSVAISAFGFFMFCLGSEVGAINATPINNWIKYSIIVIMVVCSILSRIYYDREKRQQQKINS